MENAHLYMPPILGGKSSRSVPSSSSSPSSISSSNRSPSPNPRNSPSGSLFGPEFDSESSQGGEAEADGIPLQDVRPLGSLPEFLPAAIDFNFVWGDPRGVHKTGAGIAEIIGIVYEHIVYWRKNLFMLPSGALGKAFVREKARLFECMTPGNPLEPVAVKAMAIMEHLLLQNTHRNMEAREIKPLLERRLQQWKRGDLEDLLEEGQALQNRLEHSLRFLKPVPVARAFAKLMFQGKVSAACRLLRLNAMPARAMELSDDVMEKLRALHPEAQPAEDAVLLSGSPPTVNPIIFEEITGDEILKASRNTFGAAGVSGGDADHWRRLLNSYGDASARCRDAMASFGRRLCSSFMDPLVLEAYLANRLIPINKNPGVRPIGIGEVFRRIIGKVINKVLKNDAMKAAGATQLCAGQTAGIEAVIHFMVDLFDNDDTDGLLMVDADNAFNRLKRSAALHNIRFVCPSYGTVIINCYRSGARLFVEGGRELTSWEGTTQGCTLAMIMYALALMPLVDGLRPLLPPDPGDPPSSSPVCPPQAWYADDSQAAGRIPALRMWWDHIVEHGPGLGYYPKPSKTILIVKPEKFGEAVTAFKGTGVVIKHGGGREEDGGHRDLGAAIGSSAFVLKYLSEKVDVWTAEISALAKIAATQPHAAHAAFTFGLRSRWVFLQRTMVTAPDIMQPMEDAIHHEFLPALLGIYTGISVVQRDLYALPAREGGLGIVNPVHEATTHYANSRRLTEMLGSLLSSSSVDYDVNHTDLLTLKILLRKERGDLAKEQADSLRNFLSPEEQRAMTLNREKGASSIFTTIPLKRYGFAIENKEDYRDILRLRYRLPIPDLPPKCICGDRYTLDHSQMCINGGFIHMRHDEPKSLFARLCTEVHRDVEEEPPLLRLSGEVLSYKSAIRSDEARSDVRVRSFWRKQQSAYFEFRVFYPFAPTYFPKAPMALYKAQEKTRRREYMERISNVDCGSFTPMVMSSTGGIGPQMSMALKCLAQKLAEKRKETPSVTAGVLRARFAFAAARSALICLRGSRSRFHSGRIGLVAVENSAVVSAEIGLRGSRGGG